jgi:hypothetical protein
MSNYDIFRALAIVLLSLSAASGVALFAKAVTGTSRIPEKGVSTLWGLFLIGLVVGIIILAAAGS